MAGQHNYSQSVIGDCGHVCAEWPNVSGKIICDTCTGFDYGIGAEETIAVWVRPKESASPITRAAKAAKKRAPRKPKPPPVVKCSLCQKKGHRYDACPLISFEGKFADG